jgi:hypothetical protein
MDSNSQFSAPEVMCCGRAAAARKEVEDWLSEAEEWRSLEKRNRRDLVRINLTTNPNAEPRQRIWICRVEGASGP